MAELLATPWTAADDAAATPISGILGSVVAFMERCMAQMADGVLEPVCLCPPQDPTATITLLWHKCSCGDGGWCQFLSVGGWRRRRAASSSRSSDDSDCAPLALMPLFAVAVLSPLPPPTYCRRCWRGSALPR